MTERTRSRLLTGRINLLRSPEQRQTAAYIAAAIIFLVVIVGALTFDGIAPFRDDAEFEVGMVAPRDVLAPYTLTYPSVVLTETQRQVAQNNVSPIYDPPDPEVARQQIALLQQVITYINDVRADSYGTFEQRLSDIQQINALTLDDQTIETILTLDEPTWQAVASESSAVLERVMRESIRDADLEPVRDALPTQVSVRFSAANAAVVTAIVEDLIRPNRALNEAATESARQLALEAVPEQTRTFERGQAIIQAGSRVTALNYEALEQFGLLVTPDVRLQVFARSLLGGVLALVFASLYIRRCHEELLKQPGLLYLLEGLFLIFVVGFAVLDNNQVTLYLYPAAALALIFVGLVTTNFAINSGVLLALLMGLMSNNSLEAAAIAILGSAIGALTLRGADRLNRYFFVGLVIALVNVVVVTMFNLNMAGENAGSLATLMTYGIINGVLAAMAALVGLYLITLLFNLPTNIKLVELSQPNQPLLQRLLRESPGTYQHSLQVANLAEQAANAIGVNAELVRVAAMYHDVGKMLNPAFFVENQVDNINPHDLVHDPYRSADIIISHVTDGERLARQYRLPARIRDFIVQHHGTTRVSYFYNRALEMAADSTQVDAEQFTYPGPKPQDREAAILMLADSSESTVRARKPTNKQEISDIVREIIESRIAEGQLDEANVTLKDLHTIREIFVEMLQGLFHPRINYPAPIRLRTQETTVVKPTATNDSEPAAKSTGEVRSATEPTRPKPNITQTASAVVIVDDDAPLVDVPPLRRSKPNGTDSSEQQAVSSVTVREGQSDDS
jgi:hypothetical protein